MDLTRAIEAGRARRTRARRVQVAVMFGALVVTIGLIALLPRRSPLAGVVTIGMNAVLIGASFLPYRADEWHRRRALQAVAVGFVASVAWQVVEAVRVLLDAGHRVNPSRALAAAGAAWLIADFFLRQSEDEPAEDDS